MPHLACVTLAVVKVTSQKSSWSRPPTSMQIIIQVFDMLNKASFLTKFYVGVLWPYTFWLQFNWERIEFTCDTRDTTSGELSEEYSLLTVSNVLMMMNVSFGLCNVRGELKTSKRAKFWCLMTVTHCIKVIYQMRMLCQSQPAHHDDHVTFNRAYSFRLSVRPSHGWISQKRLKLGLWNFHRMTAPSIYFLRGNIHPKNLTDSPLARASNKSVVEKTSHFLTLGVNISKTVGLGDTFKVTIND